MPRNPCTYSWPWIASETRSSYSGLDIVGLKLGRIVLQQKDQTGTVILIYRSRFFSKAFRSSACNTHYPPREPSRKPEDVGRIVSLSCLACLSIALYSTEGVAL